MREFIAAREESIGQHVVRRDTMKTRNTKSTAQTSGEHRREFVENRSGRGEERARKCSSDAEKKKN